MKSYLPWYLTVLLFIATGSILAAEEQAEGDASKMSIEKIIESCEQQYNEENYPDVDERNRLIDQCIDENSGNKPE